MIQEADKILKKYEDDNEYHFHECDRAWLIGAMIEFAEQQLKNCNLQNVSNNEVAGCEHKFIEVTTVADMPNKRFICAKCGASQTDC